MPETTPKAFRYYCAALRCKFVDSVTCHDRMGKKPFAPKDRKRGRYNSSGVNTFSTPYWERCAKCSGPVPIEPERVELGSSQLTVSPKKVIPNRLTVGEQRKIRKIKKPVKRTATTITQRFNALPGDAQWTGTICGCTKPRSEFSIPQKCKACRCDYVRERRGRDGRRPNTVEAKFAAMDPDGIWTGTVCKCRKPRSEFNLPQSCRVCRNAHLKAWRKERKTTHEQP